MKARHKPGLTYWTFFPPRPIFCGSDLISRERQLSAATPLNLQGKVHIEPIQATRTGFRCFAELPPYFLSMLPWIDYSYEIEGIPPCILGPPEKVVLQRYHGSDAKTFCLFTLFDVEGNLTSEDLYGRKVTIRSGQWEKFEARIAKSKREESLWMSFLYKFSSKTRSAKYPAFEATNLVEFRGPKGDKIKAVNVRPRAVFLEDNLTAVKRHADSDARIVVFPRNFLGLLDSTGVQEDDETMVAALELCLNPHWKSIEDVEPDLTGFVARRLASAREGVKRMGSRFVEIVASLQSVSEHAGSCIITSLPHLIGDIVAETLVAVDHPRVFFRNVRPSKPYQPLFQCEGDTPAKWRIGGWSLLILTPEEFQPLSAWRTKPSLSVVLGADHSYDASSTEGFILQLGALPREIPTAAPERLSCSLRLNDRVLFMASSDEAGHSFNLQRMMTRSRASR
ncbi:MAG: hypothetical protein ACE5IB_04650 [Candidatus Geothermarchaeales archaeon]